jgi:hypothetical protein
MYGKDCQIKKQLQVGGIKPACPAQHTKLSQCFFENTDPDHPGS